MTQLKRKLYYKISPALRLTVRRIYYFPVDFWRTLTAKRHKYEPLIGDIYVGSGDFIAQGTHHLQLLKKYIALRPEDIVLDVGSGIGRTAVALTTYLSESGRYEGFDVVKKGVNWCNKKIKRDFPNFNFMYVPLKNDLYNNCQEEAQHFVFPYEEQSFDKVFLFSVLTHLTLPDIANYLIEINRMLKPGGLCLFTCFYYTQENENSIAENGQFSFPYKSGNYRLMSETVKSANIALSDNLLNELITQASFNKYQIIDGYWKQGITRTDYNDFQDIVILTK